LFTIIIAACLLFSGPPSVQGQATQARIKIDVDRTIGEVNPLLNRPGIPGGNLR
jgi:hypothetical protein